MASAFTRKPPQWTSACITGTYTVTVTVASTSPDLTMSLPITVTVLVSDTPDTWMSLDSPLEGSTVSQPFNIGGWAFDHAVATGTGIDAIHVWAFPTSGDPAIFLGVAPMLLNAFATVECAYTEIEYVPGASAVVVCRLKPQFLNYGPTMAARSSRGDPYVGTPRKIAGSPLVGVAHTCR